VRPKQLVQQEDSLQSFINATPDLFVRIDRHGRIAALSPAAKDMLGVTPKRVLHHPYLSFVCKRDRPQARQAFARVMDGESAVALTLQIRHGNTGHIWAEVQAFPWLADGCQLGVQATVRDVSVWKQREDRLLRNNQVLQELVRGQQDELRHNGLLLENLLNTTSAGIGVLRQGRFQLLNSQLERITGYPATELIGSHWSRLFADQVETHGGSLELPPPESGQLQSVESRWRRADGSVIDVLFSVAPLGLGSGSDTKDASLTVIDITAGKQTERQLRGAYRELEQMFNVAVPLCLLSLDCRVRRVNQAFCAFFACTPEEVRGKTGTEIWGCKQCATNNCPMAQLQAGAGYSYLTINTEIRGQSLAATVYASRYVDAEGRLSGAVLAFFESRELKKVSADLHTTRQQLIQAERLSAIGSLAASIAHEFNNPLCGVRSVVERMRRKLPPTSTDQGILDLALDNCDRMGRLITDLQQFGRSSSDGWKVFDLDHAVDSVLLLLNKHLKMRKAVIRRECGLEPFAIHGDENQIKQALLKLVTNSAEALPEHGGTIEIRTVRDGNRVQIVVVDNGSGISEEHLPQLFDPFFSTKNTVREAGLGLSVAYGIIKAHGGEIAVASQLGHGTTFTIILPDGNESGQQGEAYAAGIHSDR
jgi:PAS domain S-box-containing protein